LASFNWVAFRFEAFVRVVTSNRVVNNSSVRTTPILSTSVKIVHILLSQWFVSASRYRVATVLGTWVVIITRDWFVKA
jgi:hypothetical protein